VKCEPYVCRGDKCGSAPCASDDDCASKFRCDPTSKDCVPKEAAVCTSDNKKLVGADGREVDCAPYLCEGGKCLQQCTGSAQCVPGFVCDTALSPPQCVGQPAAGEDGGCGCSTPGQSTTNYAWLLGVAVALAGARRRTRA
jgi:MYXO-CTERM domain-containing protein